MKLNDYLKNQIINITIAFFTIALVWVILWAFNCPRFLVFYVPFLILISFSLICGYDFWRKRNYYNRFIQCLSELDEKSQTYTMSAYLIAQLGKNFADGRNNRITGAELLELAWSVIEEMQYMGGGMVVFLEANNDDKLLKYYNDNRFSQFDTRQTASKDQETHELVQLLRLL